jgi:hypothetical protein
VNFEKYLWHPRCLWGCFVCLWKYWESLGGASGRSHVSVTLSSCGAEENVESRTSSAEQAAQVGFKFLFIGSYYELINNSYI